MLMVGGSIRRGKNVEVLKMDDWRTVGVRK